ncbi:HlyD family secretion protein [Maridesulfovibrio sp.]|uniref:HlyD family secretion protein n=1 Tax=Maridesulfovibrio sp. TaxID=2795000 RepID=UPI002A18AABD|nr:HlyD family secretion protein [Maridesulfovibrio sp.]
MNLLSKKVLLTSAVVLCAAFLLVIKFRNYISNPWTRDGQVRANVVQIAPRVSGPIVQLPIRDNQFVHKGDLLFEIDPRTYAAAMDEAQANLDQAMDQIKNRQSQVESAKASLQQALIRVRNAQLGITSARVHANEATKNLDRYKTLIANDTIAKRDYDSIHETAVTANAQFEQAQTQLDQARAAKEQAEAELDQVKAMLGASGKANPLLRQELARWEQARLNLEFTKVRAPVDGYITNLNIRQGSLAVANQPLLALIDANSFWVDSYFRESSLAHIRKGDKAVVTLMTYPEKPLVGTVESIGYGIAQPNGATGENLLPSISPTFEWIRLAQRIPVRVGILDKSKDVTLRIGTTASVLIETEVQKP